MWNNYLKKADFSTPKPNTEDKLLWLVFVRCPSIFF